MVRLSVLVVEWPEDGPSRFRRHYEYVNPAHVVSVAPGALNRRRVTEVTITMGPRYATIRTLEPVGSVARRLTLTTPST
jgi:hypothetical protein